MHALIICDNVTDSDILECGWGFSCLLDHHILFDTGASADMLFHNMEKLQVDVDGIDTVVISHDHWDHTGGLWQILKRRQGIKVAACPGFSREFKETVVAMKGVLSEAGEFRKMDSRFAVTGEIGGQYKGEYMPEQALLAVSGKGLVIITGCSHPGIVNMVKAAKAAMPGLPVTMVMGGFHLMDHDSLAIRSLADTFKTLGVEQVGPAHCTGKLAQDIFQDTYGDQYVTMGAGRELQL